MRLGGGGFVCVWLRLELAVGNFMQDKHAERLTMVVSAAAVTEMFY